MTDAPMPTSPSDPSGTGGAAVPPPPPVPSAPPPTGAPSGYGTWSGALGLRRSAGLTILLAIVTCGIWNYVWSYKTGEELKRHTNEGLGGIAYAAITFLLYPVTMFLMAGEVEKMYRRDGKQPPITMMWGLWFLLPIIGNFIWYLRIQGSLNEYWTDKGQTNNPSL